MKPPSVPPGHVPPRQTTCPLFRRPSVSAQGQGTPGTGAVPLPQLCSQPTCVLSRPQARAADPPGLGRRAQPRAPRTWMEGGGAPERTAPLPTCSPGLSTAWTGAPDPGASPETADAQAACLPVPLADRTPGRSRATPGTGHGAAMPCRPAGGANHPLPPPESRPPASSPTAALQPANSLPLENAGLGLRPRPAEVGPLWLLLGLAWLPDLSCTPPAPRCCLFGAPGGGSGSLACDHVTGDP